MVMMATAMGVSAQQAADPATMDQSALDAMMSVINGVPRLQWSIVKRGFWVNGVDNLRDFLVTTLRYTLADVGKNIACPTLVTAAENDILSKGVGQFADNLGDRVTTMNFSAAQGAGMHCEMLNRSLLNRQSLDWLDDVLGGPPCRP